MIKRFNNLSFLFFIPGMVAQIAGFILRDPNIQAAPDLPPIIGTVLLLGGTILAIVGFAYYAKAKGRNPAYGLCGLLSLPGLLILASLKDRSGDPWNT